MGGSDDPSNLIELTVEEHAEAHKKLFEQYGMWQDEIAWKGLVGIIGNEEAVRLSQTFKSEEHKIKISLALKGKERSKIHSENISKARMGIEPWNKGKKIPRGTPSWNSGKTGIFSQESLSKMSDANKKRNVKPPNMAGRIVITNGIKEKRINKFELIPDGWYRGRYKSFIEKI